MKKISTFHIFLLGIIAILGLNLITPLNNQVGFATSLMDTSEEFCTFNNKNQEHTIPLNMCCIEIQRQKECTPFQTNIKCYTSENSAYYKTNSKTLNYCKKEGYDVKIKET
tara:strand:+ start:1907 stop:2239 length:333 start_codon:yes stop_codon:yes gene_type:complete